MQWIDIVKKMKLRSQKLYESYRYNRLITLQNEFTILRTQYKNCKSPVEKEKLKQQGLELKEFEAFLKRDLVDNNVATAS